MPVHKLRFYLCSCSPLKQQGRLYMPNVCHRDEWFGDMADGPRSDFSFPDHYWLQCSATHTFIMLLLFVQTKMDCMLSLQITPWGQHTARLRCQTL